MQGKTIERITKDILLEIGIPISVNGAAYIVEAVRLGIENPGIINSMTKTLYPAIAQKFNTKPENVERAIRHAIQISWDKERIIVLNSIFNLTIFIKSEKPCNSELIALFVEKIPELLDK